MLLFEAPIDFDPAVWQAYQDWMPITHNTAEVTVWVCNPLGLGIRELDFIQFPKLRVIATPSTGTNHIDLEACERLGVKVLSLNDDREGLETISASAEFTFKLLLDAFRMAPAQELQGKYVGLIGYGRIGRKVERYCESFSMKVSRYDPPRNHLAWGLAEMFQFNDALIVCCSLTDETTGMITGDLLRSMRQNAVLVNTARGEIIDEQALIKVMLERRDLRVALDVVCGETDDTHNRLLLSSMGAIVTPHIAGRTLESRTKAARIILNLLKACPELILRKETEVFA